MNRVVKGFAVFTPMQYAYLPTEFTQPISLFHYSDNIYDSDTYTVVGTVQVLHLHMIVY